MTPQSDLPDSSQITLRSLSQTFPRLGKQFPLEFTPAEDVTPKSVPKVPPQMIAEIPPASLSQTRPAGLPDIPQTGQTVPDGMQIRRGCDPKIGSKSASPK